MPESNTVSRMGASLPEDEGRGKRARERREELGFSQNHLGKKIGSSASQIGRWEDGGRIQSKSVDKLAAGLEMSRDELVNGPKSPAATDDDLSPLVLLDEIHAIRQELDAKLLTLKLLLEGQHGQQQPDVEPPKAAENQ